MTVVIHRNVLKFISFQFL